MNTAEGTQGARSSTASSGDEGQTGRASEIQTGNACIVCWRSPTDRAHVIDRSLAPDPYGDPRRVVFMCREHHTAYDDHKLDLLPYLEPNHRSELARAVELVGLVTTIERVTGMSWRAHPLSDGRGFSAEHETINTLTGERMQVSADV